MDPLEIHLRWGVVGKDIDFRNNKVIVIDFYGRELEFDGVQFNTHEFPSWFIKDGIRFCGVKINPAA